LCDYFRMQEQLAKGGGGDPNNEVHLAQSMRIVNKDEFLNILRGERVKERERMVKQRVKVVAPGPGEYEDSQSSDYKPELKKWEKPFGGHEFVAAKFILEKYSVNEHPAVLKHPVDGREAFKLSLKEECFDYLGESLSIGRASKQKLIRYLTDESITFTDEEFKRYLKTCFPSRNPEVEDVELHY